MKNIGAEMRLLVGSSTRESERERDGADLADRFYAEQCSFKMCTYSDFWFRFAFWLGCMN